MLKRSGPRRLCLIPVLSKALDIIELLQKERGPLSLETMYQRSHISKTTIYRILKTFVHCGYVALSEDGLYQFIARPKKALFGFVSQSAEMAFSREVTESLRTEADYSPAALVFFDFTWRLAGVRKQGQDLE